MTYGYARFWAGALTALGTLFVLLGILTALAMVLVPAIGGLFRTRLGVGEVLAAGVLAVLAVLSG
jgi:hypothetical protein